MKVWDIKILLSRLTNSFATHILYSVINMVINLKRTIVVLFALSLVVLCACEKTPNDTGSIIEVINSSTTNFITSSTTSQLNSSQLEQIVDPENSEINRDTGEAVEFIKPQSVEALAHGIDVSIWQGRIDWQSVKNAGVDFAIIRIGYRGENGIIYRDDNADYNIQQAQNAGVLVGVYFFSTATTVAEAHEEAVWTVEAIKGYKISYPVVYDCEGYTNSESRMYGITAAARTDNAIEFLKCIKDFGYDAMLYGAKADFENAYYWDIARVEKDYKIWVAHYSQAIYPTNKTPNYNGRYDMWQYTNRGTVSGVDGNCDMIVSYFTVDEAVAKDSSATPETAKPPKTLEEMLYETINDEVTAKDEVNLRSGAGTKFDVVATLKSGEFVTRTGIGSNGWSRIIYNGQTVYAVTSYLSNEVIDNEGTSNSNDMLFSECNDSVTAKMEVNLRAEPTTNSEIVGTLQSGVFLQRTAISDKGWSKLDYNGMSVYAITSYLSNEVIEESEQNSNTEADTIIEHGITFSLTTINVTAKDEVNLRDMPTTEGSNIVGVLKNGESIIKTGVSYSGWARLEWNGQIVYCVDSFLIQQ